MVGFFIVIRYMFKQVRCKWYILSCFSRTRRFVFVFNRTGLVLAYVINMYVCMYVCTGARCSSVVRAFAHGSMNRRIDPSWSGPIELFLVPASAPRLV